MTTQIKKILVVEDDAAIRQLIVNIVQGMDLLALEAQTVEVSLAIAIQHRPDLVLLDLGLPDSDGMAFINSYRSWSTHPILVLSARQQEHEKVKALDAGADDYLTKPFGAAELMARIRALLRRRSTLDINAPKFSFGSVEVDLGQHRITKDNQEIHLSPIEYQLLKILLTNGGRVVTHRQLLKEVWGGQHAQDNHYLRVYMGHLRQKLEDDPAQPKYLITETGVGYRLNI